MKLTRFGENRHSIYLRKELVTDSAFPFSVKDELRVRIEGSKLVIEKAEANARRRRSA